MPGKISCKSEDVTVNIEITLKLSKNDNNNNNGHRFRYKVRNFEGKRTGAGDSQLHEQHLAGTNPKGKYTRHNLFNWQVSNIIY